MEESEKGPSGPDLSRGVPLSAIEGDDLFPGHVEGEEILLVRSGESWFAVGASCTHYGVSLAGGLVADGTIRCPAHHAAFDLATGEAVRGPALRAIPCWDVEVREGRVFVTRRRAPAPAAPTARRRTAEPGRIVIVGAGAAGTAAATELRRQGYQGAVTLLGAEASAPYDRPNLSKDFLAGSAPEEWLPLHPDEFYRERGIDLRTGTRAARLDVKAREVLTLAGGRHGYDRLLLATGAEAIRLPLATHAFPHVHYLRSLAESRSIVKAAGPARRAVVVGASFIGLEAAASLRARGLEVRVVAPDRHPLERVLGPEVGAYIRSVHEEHGVAFHLGEEIASVEPDRVRLRSGKTLPADLVVVGIGVRPGVGLASWAQLRLHHAAVAVDELLETSAPGVFAAGDLVAWPDPRSGGMIRSEHWVVAQRQGQTAARNMLGLGERFDAVPFFWSAHFDTSIRYVGHAERWDRVDQAGEPGSGAFALAYRASTPGGERTLAVATIGRDRDNLRAELALERYDWETLEELVPSRQPAAAPWAGSP
jgi:NADPH-dependent 2,4-dienoyl-CoA reductase/sulfur reductase-like enzyme/nitrite reductase/ring-hydroxylating ferredoxin subunit